MKLIIGDYNMKEIKKKYFKPSMIVVELKSRQSLLVGSEEKSMKMYEDENYDSEFN